jgi:hypothetical protein
MQGQELGFSEADVKACVAAYDPKVYEAPIVIGHPTADAPAYGWVKGLELAGDVMCAAAGDLDPAFAAAVQAKRYTKVSSSFFRPNSPANPKPGTWYLRHVGFLGATAPAVPGLKPVSFAGTVADSVTVEVEFGDWGDRTVAGLFRTLRDFLIGKFGQDEADKALPPWDVNTAQDVAAQPASADVAASPGFGDSGSSSVSVSEDGSAPEAVQSGIAAPPPVDVTPVAPPATPPQDTTPVVATPATPPPPEQIVDPREAELTRRETELRDREAKLRASELAQKHAEHAAFCESLVKDGRPLPCSPDLVVSFMRLLDGEADSVSFGEGETRSPLELFKSELLAKLPKRVEFAEFASGGDTIDLSDPEAIAAAAVAYQSDMAAKGMTVSTSAAVNHVKGAR